MIQREELEQILNFVGNRWIESTKDPDNKTYDFTQECSVHVFDVFTDYIDFVIGHVR